MKSARWLATLALLLLLAGCGSKELRAVPEDLVGKWVTSSKPYADRFFELREHSVVIATGDGQADEHFVLSVAANRAEGMIDYVIRYSGNEGESLEFSFSYNPTTQAIHFTNQKTIEWKKASIT